jgi:hypothetical protein
MLVTMTESNVDDEDDVIGSPEATMHQLICGGKNST